ncbi:MAG: Gfo/Idh/MocA family oxidoreductase, partial [Acidobacteriota bacterium]
MVGVGVIGYGYWGPNIVRNLQALEDVRVAAICDRNPAALRRAADTNYGVKLVENPLDLISMSEVDAVAVVSPVWTHFELAKAALQNGKHVFVEKPFTRTVAEAEQLIEIGQKNNRTIMVDHTFLFTGAVRKIRQLIDEGTLGTLYYYDSMRVNLGLF